MKISEWKRPHHAGPRSRFLVWGNAPGSAGLHAELRIQRTAPPRAALEVARLLGALATWAAEVEMHASALAQRAATETAALEYVAVAALRGVPAMAYARLTPNARLYARPDNPDADDLRITLEGARNYPAAVIRVEPPPITAAAIAAATKEAQP